MIDTGDNEAVGKRKKKAQIRAERQREELRSILQTPGGRNWVWRLLEHCGVFRTLSASDPHNMAILSGRRDIGLKVIEDIFEADPKAYTLMQQEAKERDKDV